MGYSAGGWYAYAVAAALLQRGASLGMVAILDTSATTRIHRRLSMALFGRQVGSRLLPALQCTLRPPAGQSRRRYAVGQVAVAESSRPEVPASGVTRPQHHQRQAEGNCPAAS